MLPKSESPRCPPLNPKSRSGALIEPQISSVSAFITLYFNCPSDYKVHKTIYNGSLDHYQTLKGQDTDGYTVGAQMDLVV